jgi:7,8-dihydropterin-6-yl-methyl-4-(beta-D-ribofuranosyl)aminobenzene 5'-phosphate synthase
MIQEIDRRKFLARTALAAGAVLAAGPASRCARAAPIRIDAPPVDKVDILVIIDTAHDVMIANPPIAGVKVERTRTLVGQAQNRTLECEWGLSLHLESHKGDETRRYLLDFGYTPDVLNNNLELLGIDVSALDGLILSHGHLDHFGGLQGFLEQHRSAMRTDLRLFTGGEDNFCYRLAKGPDGKVSPFGLLDRRELAARGVTPVLSEDPLVIDGHAFTTGAVPRNSIEHVMPNTLVSFGAHDGAGCDTGHYASHHFTPEELSGQPIPDQHWHEQATCFNVKDRGLVVITSCGHGGIVNALRRAQNVTGVEKIHALLGGFHLAPAPDDYLAQVMAELKKFDLDHIVPMHCSGTNFVDAAKREMPEKLILCTAGTRFTFGTA